AQKSTAPAPPAASMPAFAAAAKPSGGWRETTRRRSAARLFNHPAMRASSELSTITASKSALQWVKTESSHRSASGCQPCTTASSVTARGMAFGSSLGWAFRAWSSLPVALSTTSHPPARSSSRIASAFSKSRSRRRSVRSSRRSWAAALSVLFGFDRRGQCGDDLQRVADDPEVRHLHDRRFRVLVDRDDHLRGLHTDRVLHRAGDADRDVDAGADRLARLADLHRVRHPPGVDHGAARADRGSECVRQVFEQWEVLRTAHPPSATDHDLCVLEL